MDIIFEYLFMFLKIIQVKFSFLIISINFSIDSLKNLKRNKKNENQVE